MKKHNNLTLKHSQITQILLFLNTLIIYTEHLAMIIFIILQKYIPHLLVLTLNAIQTQNPKCGINGMTLTGHLEKV